MACADAGRAVFDNHIDVFAPGCFARSLAGGVPVRFLIDHDETQLLGTSADRLELLSDDLGVAFRLRLPNGGAATIGERTGMSLGYRPVKTEELELEGESVRIIRDARLDEISAVKHGVVYQAFASFVDGVPARSLRDECRSRALLSEGSAIRLRDAFKDFGTNVFELVQRAASHDG